MNAGRGGGKRGARAALAAALWLAAAAARAGGVVHVPEQVWVDGPVIALGDIAAFDGLSPQLEAQLAALAFGPSGAIAGQQPLPGARVREAVLSLDPSIWVEVPEQIAVHRGGTRIERAALAERVERAIRHSMPWPQAAVRFARWSLPDALSGAREHSRLLVHLRPGERFLRRVSVELELVDPQTGAGSGARSGASVQLDVQLPVAVAARSLRRGELLDESALRMETRALERLPDDTVTDLREALGQPLAVALREGTALALGQLASPDLVKRGDAIAVDASQGALEIRLEAQALEAGRLGQRIRARNRESRRELAVRVTGPRSARLDAAGEVGAP